MRLLHNAQIAKDILYELVIFCTTYDLTFASTETKFKNPITKTQNNIVIFGFFHKKNTLLFWLFFEII